MATPSSARVSVDRRTVVVGGLSMAGGAWLLGRAQPGHAADGEESLGPWIAATAATGLRGNAFNVTLLDAGGSGGRARVEVGGAEAPPGLLAALRPGKEVLIAGEVGPDGTIVASRMIHAVFGDESDPRDSAPAGVSAAGRSS
jgi:hypothetical protein